MGYRAAPEEQPYALAAHTSTNVVHWQCQKEVA